MLTQRVDWVAWASIQFYDARDAIDDACTTSSDLGYIYIRVVSFPDPHVLPPERGSGIITKILGCAESACVWKFRNVT